MSTPSNVIVPVREHRETVIIDAKNLLRGSADNHAIQLKIQDLLNAGHKQIVLNMDAIPFLDCPTAGDLAAAYQSAKQSGGELKLVRVTRPAMATLHATAPKWQAESYANEAAALSSFRVHTLPGTAMLEPYPEVYIG